MVEKRTDAEIEAALERGRQADRSEPRAVSGRYVVTMDDDLQNPPGEALKLLAVAEAEKRDVVFGVYQHKEHSWWRNAGSVFSAL